MTAEAGPCKFRLSLLEKGVRRKIPESHMGKNIPAILISDNSQRLPFTVGAAFQFSGLRL
jgi:hypothetical protein